jgi:hypothetical protein
VYVYDGLPPQVGRGGSPGSRLLASLCSDDIPHEEILLEATSGLLAVYYVEVFQIYSNYGDAKYV